MWSPIDIPRNTPTHEELCEDEGYYAYLCYEYGEAISDDDAMSIAKYHGTNLDALTADWLPYSLRDSAGYVSTLALVLALGY